MRQKFIAILSLLLVIFVDGDSFAKSGQEHIQLWDNVFGISENVSRNNILPLWRTAQEVIDRYKEDYQKRARKPLALAYVIILLHNNK